MQSLYQALINLDLPHSLAVFLSLLSFGLGLLILALLIDRFAKMLLAKILKPIISRTHNNWDDLALKHGLFDRLAHFAPGFLLYLSAPLLRAPSLAWSGELQEGLQRLAILYMIFATIRVADSFLNALVDIYGSLEVGRQKPIKSYAQVVKIILLAVAIVLGLSAILGKSPWFFLTGLGAMTAVILLIFKDSILGLVASVQVNTYDMIRLGDWIEMPKFGVDGEVIDVSLNTVKVQNWDKTILMVPTHALLNESVKNWRGMSESGGRRIKRSLYLDMSSVKLLEESDLKRLEKIQLLAPYLKEKQAEIRQYNQENNIDTQSLVNGRNLTNLGSFRAYVEAYVKNHPKIHQGLTLLVRHLQPTEVGLPLEIYIFSTDQVWANYESIQADIFEHLLAVLPEFDLQVFQRPNGQRLTVKLEREE